jgi:N-acetylglucosaminyldiphosphoundecaprenol N-acetyl-beta-D-mannosaminyltransferase
MTALQHRFILGTRVDATSYADATARILEWAQAGESRYVCICGVHGVMEGHDVEDFQKISNAADLVTPDGMPLVWVLRRLGLKDQSRVYGPDLTLERVQGAAEAGIAGGIVWRNARGFGCIAEELPRTLSATSNCLCVLASVSAIDPRGGRRGRAGDQCFGSAHSVRRARAVPNRNNG